MTRLVNGIEIEQNLVQIAGSAEIDDDQANELLANGTIEITLRGHLKSRSQQPGGQNTSPREVFSIALDSLDALGEGEDVDGQLKIDAPTPDDAD